MMNTLARLVSLVLLVAILLVSVVPALAQDATPTPETAPAAAVETAAPSGMLTGLRHLHSAVRWLVVLLTAVLLVKLVMGMAQASAYDALTQRLQFWFAMGLTLQWAIGLVFLIVYGSTVGFGNIGRVWGHLVIMTVALGIAHMGSGKRFKAMDAKNRYRNTLLLVLLTLVLVYVGVASVGGW